MDREIKDHNDIRLLVDTFYERVRKDELLSPIFAEQVKDIQPHLESLYRFWQAVLLEDSAYEGAPFQKHEGLHLMNQHFTRWLTLFLDTIDELYTGASAEQARLKAIRMAEELQYKLELNHF